MIRLAVCDARPKTRAAVRQGLDALAKEAGLQPYAISQFSSADEALEALASFRPGYYAMLLCGFDSLSEEGKRELLSCKKRFSHTRLVIASGDPSAALLAYRMHADDFLPVSETGGFQRVVSRQFAHIVQKRDATITLKTTEGIDVLEAGAILFAETSKAGPVIHLADGREVRLRGTLQNLYEQMAHDSRFAKAGSSFIVNLDNVRSAGKSSLVFPDGSVIIVPIRARKPFQETLEAYRAG